MALALSFSDAGDQLGVSERTWLSPAEADRLNAAVAWDVIPRNPIKQVKAPRDLTSRPHRWYSKDDLTRIYEEELEIQKCTTKDDAALHREFRWTWQLMANDEGKRHE